MNPCGGIARSPLILYTEPVNRKRPMDRFLTTAQIDEHPLIDISPEVMTDEQLAALLEVTVDQLLGLTPTN